MVLKIINVWYHKNLLKYESDLTSFYNKYKNEQVCVCEMHKQLVYRRSHSTMRRSLRKDIG